MNPRNYPQSDKKDGQCNQDCSGHVPCGGFDAINVYGISSTASGSVSGQAQASVQSASVQKRIPSSSSSKYLGCYRSGRANNWGGRKPRKEITVVTPDSCIAACYKIDIPTAGVENGDQCWCGNSLPPENDRLPGPCSMKCRYSKNQEYQKCGAFDKINVYKIHEAENLGCYRSGGKNRITGWKQKNKNGDENSPETCIDLCDELEYTFAGVESGDQCWCGNTSPNEEDKLRSGECNQDCTGKAKCGGFDAINMYSIETTAKSEEAPVQAQAAVHILTSSSSSSSKYFGCYESGGNNRVLTKRIDMNNAEVTPENCIEDCGEYSYIYAGVETGAQCWCGNTKYQKRDRVSGESGTCNDECTGIKNQEYQKCGAHDRIDVYRVDKAVIEYKGCYEGGNSRRLPVRMNKNGDENSPETCIDMCQQEGYRFSGVESGDQCFCGNRKPKVKKPGDCNQDCTGKAKCGGFDKINVYSVSTTGRSAASEDNDQECIDEELRYHVRTLKDDMVWNEQFTATCQMNCAASCTEAGCDAWKYSETDGSCSHFNGECYSATGNSSAVEGISYGTNTTLLDCSLLSRLIDADLTEVTATSSGMTEGSAKDCIKDDDTHCISTTAAHPWLAVNFASPIEVRAIKVIPEGSHEDKNYLLEFRSMNQILNTSADNINTEGCLLFFYNYEEAKVKKKELFRTQDCPPAVYVLIQVVSA